MSVSSMNTVNQSKLKFGRRDLWPTWLMLGYGIVMAALILVGVVTKRSATEIGTMMALNWLPVGWFLLIPIHIGQQVRIAKLEQRLADLESSQNS